MRDVRSDVLATLSPRAFQDILRIQIRTRRLIAGELLGTYRSAFKGHGMEFNEVREFEPGDDLRHIDWNVTARMRQPFVKTYREERSLTVNLIVDVSASARFGSVTRSKQALIAEIGALLAFSAIENNDKIGLLLFSGDVEEYLPPTTGQRHALRIVRDLLTAKARQPGTDLGRALTFLGRLQKKPAICFIISDFLTDHYAHALKIASKHYECVAIRVLDPRELVIPPLQLLRMRDLETNQDVLIDTSDTRFQHEFEQHTKDLMAHQEHLFKRLGVGLIDIRTEVPYTRPIKQFFLQHKNRI